MNKTIRILFFVAIAGVSFTACKSKQKMTAIPGANVPATTTTSPTTSSSTVSSTTAPAKPATTTSSQAEVTKTESFKLAAGETNNAALTYKYHVVVGAFNEHERARNLRSKLTNEGNSALTVENEMGMLRVIIASYNEYLQAKARIEQIKGLYPDAWVLVQK
jgi:cell division septation protein DedD